MKIMTPTDPSAPIAAAAIPPIRPALAADDAATRHDRDDDRPDEDRRRGAETTLRYKFDWLVQRQVSAGTIDPDEAAEMIRLFDDTVAAPEAERDDPEDPATPARRGDAATALLDRLRDRFGSDGPYDDSGSQTPSTPAGMMVDEQL